MSMCAFKSQCSFTPSAGTTTVANTATATGTSVVTKTLFYTRMIEYMVVESSPSETSSDWTQNILNLFKKILNWTHHFF